MKHDLPYICTPNKADFAGLFPFVVRKLTEDHAWVRFMPPSRDSRDTGFRDALMLLRGVRRASARAHVHEAPNLEPSSRKARGLITNRTNHDYP